MYPLPQVRNKILFLYTSSLRHEYYIELEIRFFSIFKITSIFMKILFFPPSASLGQNVKLFDFDLEKGDWLIVLLIDY